MDTPTNLSKNPNSVPHPHWGAEKIYYLSNKFCINGHIFLAWIFKRINQFIFHVNIQPQAIIGNRLELAHGGFGTVIHADTIIGDDAIIFHNVTIGNGGARIGDRVTIGTGAVLIGAVTIGNDVKIGANTVVNFDVPDNSTVVGSKGRILGPKNSQ